MDIFIRPASTEDIPDIARIHLASKKKAYEGIVDQAFLDDKTQNQYEEKWQNWFSQEDMDIALLIDQQTPKGFISYGRMQTPPPGTSKIRPQYTAEIFAIHIHPDYWREGLGSQLIQYASQVLKDQKHQSLCLWVLAKNERATKFYDSLQGKRLGKRVIEVGRSKVKEICYGWRNISEILDK